MIGRRRRARPPASTGSTTTRCSPSTARSSASGRTTSGRSSTTGRAGSGRTRSSAATRRSRPVPSTRSRSATGSSRATATRRSACSAACRPATILQWWRGHPSGWWNPEDVNVASICVPDRDAGPARRRPRLGHCAEGIRRGRAHALRRRRDLRRRVPRGREHRGRHEGAARPALQQQPVGDLDPARARRPPPPGCATRPSATACPAIRVDGHDVLAVYEAVREGVARARAGDGPTFVEAVTYRSAPHATADDPSLYIDPERVAAEQERDCVATLRGVPRAARRARRRAARRRQGGGARRRCAPGSRRPRTSPQATPSSSSRTRTPSHRVARARPRRADGGCTRCEHDRRGDPRAAARRGDQRRAPRRACARRDGDGARRGRRPRSAASFARPPASATGSAPTAASTRRSPRPGSSAPPSASAWRAGARSSRCSTTRSPTRASTS